MAHAARLLGADVRLGFAVGTANRSHPALAPPPPLAGDGPVPGRPWPQAFIGTRGQML
jgi:hypothetical protein